MAEEPVPRHQQRAADADRDLVAADLRDAFSEGRLDQDEYERRLDAVWQSRTYGELERLNADLPQPLDRVQAQAEAEHRRTVEEQKKREFHEYLGEWQAWLCGAVIMIGIWAATSVASGELRNFWPAFPVGIWGVILLAGMLGRGGKH